MVVYSDTLLSIFHLQLCIYRSSRNSVKIVNSEQEFHHLPVQYHLSVLTSFFETVYMFFGCFFSFSCCKQITVHTSRCQSTWAQYENKFKPPHCSTSSFCCIPTLDQQRRRERRQGNLFTCQEYRQYGNGAEKDIFLLLSWQPFVFSQASLLGGR